MSAPDDYLIDRFNQKYRVGDFVVFATRVGNVAETRFALVTTILPKLTVKSLIDHSNNESGNWVFGRESNPNARNVVKITLPDSDGIHLV